MGRTRGPANGNWKGGRSIASNGYVLVRVGVDHHLADVRGYAYEHRLVAEEKVGRRLRPGEEVHHVNGDKADNRKENIEVLTTAEHGARHRAARSSIQLPGQTNEMIQCACGCREMFFRFDRAGRERRFVSGHNQQASPTIDAVLGELRKGPGSPTNIATAIGKSPGSVGTALNKMRKKGMVESAGRGEWRIAAA